LQPSYNSNLGIFLKVSFGGDSIQGTLPVYDDAKALRNFLPAEIVKFINSLPPSIITLKLQNGIQQNR
jgi:hypothetical protein